MASAVLPRRQQRVGLGQFGDAWHSRSAHSLTILAKAWAASIVPAAVAQICMAAVKAADALARCCCLVMLPQLEARHADDDHRHAGDDIVAILLPQLFEPFAADVLLDFAEDVGHGKSFWRRAKALTGRVN